MPLPWISRACHDQMLAMMVSQLEELKQERRILLDRLAAMGLGGPLFHCAPAEAEEAESAEIVDPERELQEMLRLRRRPSTLAQALTRKAKRERDGRTQQPAPAWIPDISKIDAALNEAEALAARQAN